MPKRTAVDEPLHPIQVVARRTGLTQDAIRVWERRYEAVRPLRTGTNRRLYTEEEIDRLILMRKAVLGGRPIRDVARLSTERLAGVVAEDESAAANAPKAPERAGANGAARHVAGCLEALDQMDAARIRLELRRASMDLAIPTFLEEVVVPFMGSVGAGWQEGRLTIAQEHLASAIVRSTLHALLEAHDRDHDLPDRIVVAAPPGQKHEFGALVAAIVAAMEGWRVAFLGTDLPLDEVAATAHRIDARAVALSFTPPAPDPEVARALERLGAALPPGTIVLAGGSAAQAYAKSLDAIGARTLGGIQSLRETLRELASAASPFRTGTG